MVPQHESPRLSFSQRTRAYNLARLRAELFDLVIIGGGIVGAAVAREAALRGYKVALAEKNDFGSGSTSQSSKLIQGGLGPLQDLRLHLAYGGSRERDRLLRIAPNLVWPMPYLYPIYRDGPYTPDRVNRSLWLYDAIAPLRRSERHRMLTSDQTTAALPQLDAQHIVGGGQFQDAQTDDLRLVLETIRSAHRHGAVIVNHFQIVELLRSAGKHIDGLLGLDPVGNEYISVRSRVVLNATGPWTESVLALDDANYKPRILPTKGVHLLVPWERMPVQQVSAFTVRSDGRLMYVMPRDNGFTLIGTTATDYAGSPEDVHAEPGDVDYILAAMAAEFPRAQLVRGDVVSSYAGLWPHVAPNTYDRPHVLSREYDIWETPSGLINIAGGRLTIHRAMAEDLVNRVGQLLSRDFGVRATNASRSAHLPLVEWNGKGEILTRAQVETRNALSKETADYLARTFGLRQGRVLDYVRADNRLGAPIVDGLPYIWAEVPHAVEHEMAITVQDIMIRRLDIFHQVRDGAIAAAQEVGRYLSRLVDWLDPDIDEQVADYVQTVARNRRAFH